MGHKKDHDENRRFNRRTEHSEKSISGGTASTSPSLLVPSDGIYTASAGNSHTAALSILSQGASIEFYVITPNDAHNDVSTFLATASGDGTISAVSVDYTFPAHGSGDYTFYATIYYNDGRLHTPHPSYTVSVTASTPIETSSPTSSTLSNSLVSSDGVYSAVAGDSHTANLSVSSGWTAIYWYLKSPSESGLGTSQSSVSDNTGNSTTASYTYGFPSGVSGDYVLTAYTTLSGSMIVQLSYTVSVSLPSSSTPPATPTPTPTVSLPVWSDIPDPYNLTVGDSFTSGLTHSLACGGIKGGKSLKNDKKSGIKSLKKRNSKQGHPNLRKSCTLNFSSYVTGSPTLTWGGGRPPAGLRFRYGVLSGTVTSIESRGYGLQRPTQLGQFTANGYK